MAKAASRRAWREPQMNRIKSSAKKTTVSGAQVKWKSISSEVWPSLTQVITCYGEEFRV